MAIMSKFLSNSGLIFSKISKIKQENPSLSARNKRTEKFSCFVLYPIGSLLTKRVENKTRKTRQRSCFLQRNAQKGWASEAKPIPTSKQTENKTRKTRQRFLISCKGIPKRDGRAKRSQFRPQSRQKTKQGKRADIS